MTPDADLLAMLHAEGFGPTSAARPWNAGEFASLLRDTHVFIVHPEDPARGFALGRAVAGEAELLTLVVAPKERRTGQGLRLLAAFELEALARGAGHAFLEVAADNAAARALYLKAGYVSTGRRPGYYSSRGAPAVDALVFSRVLTQGAGRPIAASTGDHGER